MPPVRHRRVVVTLGDRLVADTARQRPAVPTRRDGRPHRRHDGRGDDLRGAARPADHGQGPARHHLAAAPGRLHDRVRPERVPHVGTAVRRRHPCRDAQPVGEQLRGRATGGASGSSASKAIGTGRPSRASSDIPSGSTATATRPRRDARSTRGSWSPSSTRSSPPNRSRSGRRSSRTEPDFFWAPFNSLEDLVADPQFAAAGGIVDVPDGAVDHHDGGDAGRLPRHAGRAALDRPALGQHTEEVLAELARRR